MGVLPLQFHEGTTAQSLKLDGSESYDIVGLDANIKPQQDLTLENHPQKWSEQTMFPSVAGSIPRSKLIITSTAEFCRSSCGSWWPGRESEPRHQDYRGFQPRPSGRYRIAR